jgi:uncharacterized protein (UPF0332 family)
MRTEYRDYVRYRIERAEQALRVARRAVDAGDLHEAVGRLYYVCFHAVCALLLTEGKTATKHQGVWTLFDQTWVKTDRLPREMGRLYHRFFRNRQEADYAEQVVFQPEEVALWLRQATEFLDSIRGETEKQLKEDTEGDASHS